MSEELFGIIRKLDGSGTEKQIVLQCAPLLTGIKMSNLLNIREEQKEEVEELFRDSPVSCRVLYRFQGRISILLYRGERMGQYLGREEVRALLKQFGYKNVDLEEIFGKLSRRYQEHMEGRRGFPHEIGLLLEYPPEDVSGFIEKEGKDFLYSGYWKVYGNLKETLKVFEGYDRARETVIRMAGKGKRIKDIMAAC